MLVLLSQDLMIAARVEGAAQQSGLSLRTVRDTHAAVEAARAPECRVLVVDLKFPGIEIAELVDTVQSSRDQPLSIIACAPHVHEAKLTAARKAGCDVVITRGQLDRELESILAAITKPE